MSVGRCHSAFQHYEMFHGHGACHGGGNNYGSIFNINYSCNGGHGNFWSGLGAGLGYGLGGWLMGGLNMLGGWLGFGGMGFGGGWGMGMPMLGWGGGATTNNVTSNNTGRVRTRTIEKTLQDQDSTDITNLTIRVTDLEMKDGRTLDEIDSLLDEVTNYKQKDELDKDNNTNNINDLIRRLNDMKSKTPGGEAPENDGVTITINNITYTISDITIEDVKQWQEDDIEGLNENQAKQILVQIGYITDSDGIQVGKLSNIYPVLLLLAKSGVTVEVEYREKSYDKWIKGPISDVQITDDGKLSYTVNAEGVPGAIFEGKYRFASQNTENTKYKVDEAEGNEASITINTEIELDWQNEKQPLLNNSDNPLVRKKI